MLVLFWLNGNWRGSPHIWGCKMAGKTEQKDSMSKGQVTIPLDLPDVRILKTELNKRGDLVITVESTKTETGCRK